MFINVTRAIHPSVCDTTPDVLVNVLHVKEIQRTDDGRARIFNRDHDYFDTVESWDEVNDKVSEVLA